MALCHKLHDTPRVAVFALLKAQAATLCLQSDLWMLGRPVYSHISFQQQQEYLNSCPPDSLLVVFSYTGSYFSYFPPLPPRDKRPFVAMIAGTPHPKKDPPCPEADLYVPFASSRRGAAPPVAALIGGRGHRPGVRPAVRYAGPFPKFGKSWPRLAPCGTIKTEKHKGPHVFGRRFDTWQRK